MAGDKCSLTFVISFFVLFFLPLLIVSSSKNATSVEESFRNFIIRYNRTYLYDVDEYNQRLAIFKVSGCAFHFAKFCRVQEVTCDRSKINPHPQAQRSPIGPDKRPSSWATYGMLIIIVL